MFAVQVDMDNDGAVSWEELSTFMIETRMEGWARESEVGVPNYSYTGQIESARPAQAAEQVRGCQISSCSELRGKSAGESNSRFRSLCHNSTNHLLCDIVLRGNSFTLSKVCTRPAATRNEALVTLKY